jgi:hypothetical protein
VATALDVLGAIARGDPRRLRPTRSHLAGAGHILPRTNAGMLDVLGTIEEATTFEDLVPFAELTDLGGFDVRVLSLPRLLEVKRKLDRPKDRLMALQIEATLAERARSTRA